MPGRVQRRANRMMQQGGARAQRFAANHPRAANRAQNGRGMMRPNPQQIQPRQQAPAPPQRPPMRPQAPIDRGQVANQAMDQMQSRYAQGGGSYEDPNNPQGYMGRSAGMGYGGEQPNMGIQQSPAEQGPMGGYGGFRGPMDSMGGEGPMRPPRPPMGPNRYAAPMGQGSPFGYGPGSRSPGQNFFQQGPPSGAAPYSNMMRRY